MAGRKSKAKREKTIVRAMGHSKAKKKTPKLLIESRASASEKKSRRAGGALTVQGIFRYSGKGYGFCEPDGESAALVDGDIFIPPRKTMGAMSGDRVTVSAKREADGRYEGEVVGAEYACRSLIGTLHVEDGFASFTPDSRSWGVLIFVSLDEVEKSGASDGSKVELVPVGEEFFTREHAFSVRASRDMPYFDAEGQIAQVFGSALSREANYAAILYAFGIRTAFPEAALRHSDEVSRQPIQPEGRVDLRDRLILTIDGADAKDLDDAISLEKAGENWVLGVHIADVSHYVRPNSPTEEEAGLRGTSVYFTDKVVPMLPESLSNGSCSLNAGTDKYALTAELTLTPGGKRIGTRIYKSLIRSSVRGVYSEVNDLFERGTESPFYEKYRAVFPMLTEMKALYEVLHAEAEARSVLELEDSEAVIVLDETGHPVDILRRERGVGEKLIEQFMLQANRGVAETLKSLGLPCLYRTHEEPDGEKLQTFAVFAHNLGLPALNLTESGKANLPAQLMGILTEAQERGIGGVVSQILLRSMMKAVYQPVCAPHFGLGADVYCHFTSPIRRYPDLFVHSVITAALEKTGLSELTADSAVEPESVSALAAVSPERGRSSTDCEIRAQNAERAIEDLYMALYMADHVGETFSAAVTSVIRGGLFVQCENLAEGLVPAMYFPGCRIDEERMTLLCGGRSYTPGTPLEVVLESADVSTGKLTFAVKEEAYSLLGRGGRDAAFLRESLLPQAAVGKELSNRGDFMGLCAAVEEYPSSPRRVIRGLRKGRDGFQEPPRP